MNNERATGKDSRHAVTRTKMGKLGKQMTRYTKHRVVGGEPIYCTLYTHRQSVDCQ